MSQKPPSSLGLSPELIDQMARQAAIERRSQIARQRGEAAQTEKQPDNGQGFGGDMVDAAQYGLGQAVAGTAETVHQLTGSETAAGIRAGAQAWSESQVDQMSPEGREAFTAPIFESDEHGMGVQAGSGATNWKSWTLQATSLAGQIVPQVLGGSGLAKGGLTLAGKVVARSAMKKAVANGATKSEAVALAKDAVKGMVSKYQGKANVTGMTAMGAAMAGGMIGNEARDEVLAMTDQEMDESTEFSKLYYQFQDQHPGHSVDDLRNMAQKTLAERVASRVQSDPQLIATNLLLEATAGKYLDNLLRGVGTGSRITNAGRQALAQGGTEGLQGANEGYVVNQAMIEEGADADRNPWHGVAAQGANEAAIGGLVGGMAGAIRKGEPARASNADANAGTTAEAESATTESVAQQTGQPSNEPQPTAQPSLEEVVAQIKSERGQYRGIDDDIRIAERMGFADEAARLRAAKRNFEVAADLTAEGDVESATRFRERGMGIYRDVMEETAPNYKGSLPAEYVAVGEFIARAEQLPAPMERQGEVFEPEVAKLGHSTQGIPASVDAPFYMDTTNEAKAARQQTETAFTQQQGQQPGVRQPVYPVSERTTIREDIELVDTVPPVAEMEEIQQAALPPGGTIYAGQDRSQAEQARQRTEAAFTEQQGEQPGTYDMTPANDGSKALQRLTEAIARVQNVDSRDVMIKGQRGRKGRIKVNDDYQPVTFKLVDLSDNPDLKPTIGTGSNQPRDRSRAASTLQIAQIARNLDFNELGESPRMSGGAPTLAREGLLIGGNGRMAAIRRAYDQGTADNYRAELSRRAREFGLNPNDVDKMKQPALVRQLDNDVDVVRSAIESNNSGTMAMSPLEQAAADSKLVGKIPSLTLKENGLIDWEDADNRPVLRSFIAALPDSEQNALLDRGGQATPEARRRFVRMLMYRAYGQSQTLNNLIEDTSDDASRNLIGALETLAPRIALVNQQVQDGELHPINLSDHVVEAVELLESMRANGRVVSEYVKQLDMVSITDDVTNAIAQQLEENIRSKQAIANQISSYYDGLEAAGNPNQGSLFAVEPPTLESLAGINNGSNEQETADTGNAGQAGSSAERAPALEEAQSGDNREQPNAASTTEGADSRAEDEELLSTYDEDELRERDEQAQQHKQEGHEQSRQAEAKAKADAELNDFRLQGSDSEADVAASYGQDDLLNAPPEPEPQTTNAEATQTPANAGVSFSEAQEKPIIRNQAGNPFKTRGAARAQLRKHPGYEVVAVEGGFELHPAPEGDANQPANGDMAQPPRINATDFNDDFSADMNDELAGEAKPAYQETEPKAYPDGVDPETVRKLKSAAEYAKARYDDLAAELDNLAKQAREIPSWTETGRNNRSKSLGQQIDRNTRKQEAVWKKMEEAKKEWRKAESIAKSYAAGTAHENGMPKSRKAAEKSANDEYAEFIKSRVGKGDTVFLSPAGRNFVVQKLNRTTVALEPYGTKFDYLSIIPLNGRGEPSSSKELKAQLAEWREAKEASSVPAQDATFDAPQVPVAEAQEQQNNRNQLEDKPSEVHVDVSPHEATNTLMRRLNGGEAVPIRTVLEVFESVVADPDATKAALSKLTRPELAKFVRGHVYSDTKKNQLTRMAFDGLIQGFRFIGNDSGVISWSYGDDVVRLTRDHLESLSDKDIAEYAAKRKAMIDSQIEARNEQAGRLKNPQTLEDYRRLIQIKGIDTLSAEQRANFDRLTAEKALEESPKQDVQKGLGSDGEIQTGEPEEGRNTKTGETIFNVKVIDRLGTEKFKKAAAFARRLKGGYWKGNFYFPSAEVAQQFRNWLNGQDIDLTELTTKRQIEKKARTAARLQQMADRMKAAAEADLNAHRKTNTIRRADMAAGAAAKAEQAMVIAEVLRRVANGEAPLLRKMTEKVQAELLSSYAGSLVYGAPSELISLDNNGKRFFKPEVTPEEMVASAEMPLDYMHADSLEYVARDMEGVKGYKRVAASLRKLAKGAGEDKRIALSERARQNIMDFAAQHGTSYSTLTDITRKRKRLERMGITSLPSLRAALVEFINLKSSIDSPRKRNRLSDMEQGLQRTMLGNRKAFNDFFPTPDETANEVVELADIEPGMEVLEPSAGNGMLADAIRERGGNVDAVEMASQLRDILREKGHNLVGNDFLEMTPDKQYDRIVMNPPFSRNQDIEHVNHAYSMLRPGGRLVAIVSSMTGDRLDRKNKDFRDFLNTIDAEEQLLPSDAFKSSMNPTGVSTKVLIIDKPASKAEGDGSDQSESDQSPIMASLGDSADSAAATVAEVEEWIASTEADLKTKTNVVQSMKDLPEDVRSRLPMAAQIYGVEGAFDFFTGDTWLVADHISSQQQAIEVILHEEVGHGGVIAFLKNREKQGAQTFYDALDSIYKGVGRKGIDRYVRRYSFDYSNESMRRQAVLEYIAHMAEKGHKTTLVHRVVSALKQLLRRWFPSIPWTDTDTLALIEKGRQHLRKHGPQPVAKRPEEAEASARLGGTALARIVSRPLASERFDDLSDIQRAAMAKTERPTVRQGVAMKLREVMHRWRTKVRQGAIDRFASLLELDKQLLNGDPTSEENIAQSSWVRARMSNVASGAVSAMMNAGRIHLNKEGVIDVRKDTSGLVYSLKKLGNSDEVKRFFDWIAGNRAEQLMKQGREHLFTPDEIEGLKQLDTGTLEDGRSRGDVYQEVYQEFEQYRDDVLAIAEKAGMLKMAVTEEDALLAIAKGSGIGKKAAKSLRDAIKQNDADAVEKARNTLRDLLADAVPDFNEQFDTLTTDQRDLWMNEFYVPFYRQLEDEENGDIKAQGPRMVKGLTRQETYKKLKGGTQPLNDLLENTIMNFHHLVDASMKNLAARQALSNAAKLDVAKPVPAARRNTKASTYVMIDGMKQWYDIDDPLVFESLSAMNNAGMNGAAMKVMRGFKRIFTQMTTSTPQFIIANLLRDSLAAVSVTDMDYNAAKNVAKGMKGFGLLDRHGYERARLLASGGAFSFGHVYGEDADSIRYSIDGELRSAEVVKDRRTFARLGLKPFAAAWDRWMDVNNTAENANRMAAFQTNEKKGKGTLYSAFQARDLMDFSGMGAWPAIRFMTDVVPFLNARLQGLDKLYRSGIKPSAKVVWNLLGTGSAKPTVSEKKAAARFTAVVGALTLATVALYLRNRDDDEFRRLPDWMRDSYWWIRIPGTDSAITIPKPFEQGAIATLAERVTEQMVDDQATGKLFRERLGHMLGSTFSFNPTPQILSPVLDVYSNKDSFTGRNIEPISMQRLSPSRRVKGDTTLAAEWFSQGMESALGPDSSYTLSPLQVDHMIAGYFGQMGAWLVGSADVLRYAISDTERPQNRFYEYQPIRRFYSNLGDPKAGKEMQLFYDALQATQRLHADLKQLREEKAMLEAADFYENNKDKLQHRRMLNRVARRLSEINSRIRRIEKDPGMSSEEKRREIDLLKVRRNQILAKVDDEVRAIAG